MQQSTLNELNEYYGKVKEVESKLTNKTSEVLKVISFEYGLTLELFVGSIFANSNQSFEVRRRFFALVRFWYSSNRISAAVFNRFCRVGAFTKRAASDV